MKSRILISVLLLTLTLSGCTGASQLRNPSEGSAAASAAVTQPDGTIPYISDVTLPSSEPTAAPTTEPAYVFPLNPGSYLETYTDAESGDYLDYYLFVPENACQNMPLIIFLHGDGEVGRPDKLEDYGLIHEARNIYGESYPFIVVSPCTRTTSWTNGSIPDTLMGLIEHLNEQLSIDRNSIVLTGHSRGAMGVWYLISTYGDYFSAAVPVSCGADVTLNMENCVEVPVKAYAGTVGEYENNYRNRMFSIVTKMTESGGNAELNVLEGRDHGQTAYDAFTEETFQWMLIQ